MNGSSINSTRGRFDLTAGGVTAQLIVFFITFTLGIVGNTLLIVTVYKRPALHKVTYYLVAALAVEDTLALTTYVAFLPQSLVLGDWFLGDAACFLNVFLLYLCGSCELQLMAAISLDRYFACCRPLRYSQVITSRRCAVVIVFCYTFALALALFLMIACESYGYDDYLRNCLMELSVAPREQYCSIVVSLLSTVPCTVTIAVCQQQILKQVRRVSQDMPPNVTSATSETTSGKQAIKATITVTLMTGTYAICWFPFLLVRLSGAIVDWKKSDSMHGALYILRRITSQIFMVSKLANPIIYGLYNREFRTECRKLLRANHGHCSRSCGRE